VKEAKDDFPEFVKLFQGWEYEDDAPKRQMHYSVPVVSSPVVDDVKTEDKASEPWKETTKIIDAEEKQPNGVESDDEQEEEDEANQLPIVPSPIVAPAAVKQAPQPPKILGSTQEVHLFLFCFVFVLLL
jgi:hypothetical protein